MGAAGVVVVVVVLRMMRGWELDGTPRQEGGKALKWGRRGW